jgi:hypothetical protein
MGGWNLHAFALVGIVHFFVGGGSLSYPSVALLRMLSSGSVLLFSWRLQNSDFL